jgi:transposase
VHAGWYDRKTRRVRDLSCGDTRIYLEFDVRRVHCGSCGKVKRERLAFLADNPFYTKRFAYFVGRRCRQASIQDVCQGAQAGLAHGQRAGQAVHGRAARARRYAWSLKIIGIDEVSLRKRHTYRIVVNDLIRERPIWFGGQDRSEASMAEWYRWLGQKKTRGISLAVMDMWKPFRNATASAAPPAAILFDKFHVLRHLEEALDQARKSEEARLQGKDRRFIKGQKYRPLSNRDNLSLEGPQALKTSLAANNWLNTAYLLKETFGHLWSYERQAWARRFFVNWKAALKWQRLKP